MYRIYWNGKPYSMTKYETKEDAIAKRDYLNSGDPAARGNYGRFYVMDCKTKRSVE